MCCRSERERQRLVARRAKRKLDEARLANYKPLYLAAREARDYLKDVSGNTALVAQLDASLIDPHPKPQETK